MTDAERQIGAGPQQVASRPMDWLAWWSLVILLPAFIVSLAFVHVWAFVDGATVPNVRWRAIRHNKALWLALIGSLAASWGSTTCWFCGVGCAHRRQRLLLSR